MSYRLTPRAQSDLDDIWRYSADQWGEEQAIAYVIAIRQRLEGLAAGRIPARSAAPVAPGYLKASIGSHMLYFRRSATGMLDVIRILHQSMDVATQLRGDA